ncbi:MAG: hypothetical protein KDB22_22505 [Planctomycetales bacterium]|nr:hypothetical protein [Planctomycetales bacterium]
MIESLTWVWFVAGLAAGLMHATMLWRATRRQSLWNPMLGFVRLGLVSALLVLSALSGEILASAVGWAIGLAVLGTWFMVCGRHPTIAFSSIQSKQQ